MSAKIRITKSKTGKTAGFLANLEVYEKSENKASESSFVACFQSLYPRPNRLRFLWKPGTSRHSSISQEFSSKNQFEKSSGGSNSGF